MPSYKFKILRGSHRVGPERNEDGVIVTPGQTFKTGQVIETSVDLAKKFPSDPPKFRRVDVVEEMENDLEAELKALTVSELRARAAEEEIDLSDCHRKDEIILAFLSQQTD